MNNVKIEVNYLILGFGFSLTTYRICIEHYFVSLVKRYDHNPF